MALLSISDIYILTQIITESTLVTNTTKPLTEICFTNITNNPKLAGVHSVGISDHPLIYPIRKSNFKHPGANKPGNKRQFRNLNDS